MRKIFSYVVVLVAISLVSSTTFLGTANGAPPTSSGGSYVGDRVTICHRTNAINNPYVKITVDPDAIMNNGHGPNNTLHNIGTGVFDPDFSYPNNAKNWNDIIPPFDYTYNGVAQTFPGYNYSGRGLLIYENDCDGYAREATTTTSGGSSTTTSGGSSTTTSGGSSTTSGGGTTEPGSEETTTTTVPLPRNGVRVTVYVDLNDNCQYDDGEPTVPSVEVEVSKNSSGYSLVTDETGTVVEGPLPAGQYTGEVTGALTDLEVSCTDEDSTRVPGNGIGDIRIGLRGTKEVEIDVTPPPGEPEPEEIIIRYCGEDEVCGNEDDFEFKAKRNPDGSFSTSGLPGGKYSVTPLGTNGKTYDAIELNVDESGAFSFAPTLTASTLANAGTGTSSTQMMAVVMMILAGGSLLAVRRRKQV
jgi:LPXTG-motif cell wall-anchored protein